MILLVYSVRYFMSGLYSCFDVETCIVTFHYVTFFKDDSGCRSQNRNGAGTGTYALGVTKISNKNNCGKSR